MNMPRMLVLGVVVLLAFAFGVQADPPAPSKEEEATIQGLIKTLGDDNALVRKHAALALGELGPKAKSATADLRKLLLDKDEAVRAAAAKALDRILEEKLAERPERLRELEAKLEALKVENERLKRLSAQDDKGRQEFFKELEKALKEAQAQIQALQAEKKELRDKVVAAQIEAKVLAERSQTLIEQVETLMKDLAKLKGEKPPEGGEAVKRNPPKERVQGQVKDVDEKSGLIVLNVGSDFGLERGHTLEVYRLNPKPVYLGTVRLIEVGAKDSVGKIIGKPKEKVQAGDDVTSELIKDK